MPSPVRTQVRIAPVPTPGKRKPTGAPPIYDTEPEFGAEATIPEVQAAEEVSELLKGFRERAAREQTRYEDATDSEYWVAVCFQTREQKDEFLQKSGLLSLGDKYLDGLKVARKLGISIESPTPPMPKLRIDRRLAQLAVPFVRRQV